MNLLFVEILAFLSTCKAKWFVNFDAEQYCDSELLS